MTAMIELKRCLVQALDPETAASSPDASLLLQVPHFDDEIVRDWRQIPSPASSSLSPSGGQSKGGGRDDEVGIEDNKYDMRIEEGGRGDGEDKYATFSEFLRLSVCQRQAALQSLKRQALSGYRAAHRAIP